MKTTVSIFFLAVFAICALSFSPGKKETDRLCYSYKTFPDSSLRATLYIAYPREKEDKKFFVYFNAKQAGALTYGSRMLYNISTEGILKITISDEGIYREPATLARNTRSISVKKGKEYYFEITGKGDLDYIINNDKGKSRFWDNGSYVGAPKTIDEASANAFIKP